MKRNEDRLWFDKGYRQAVSDRKTQMFIPRTIGVFFLIGIAFFEPILSLSLFSFWTAFSYFDWRDEKRHGVDYEAPRMWE